MIPLPSALWIHSTSRLTASLVKDHRWLQVHLSHESGYVDLDGRRRMHELCSTRNQGCPADKEATQMRWPVSQNPKPVIKLAAQAQPPSRLGHILTCSYPSPASCLTLHPPSLQSRGHFSAEAVAPVFQPEKELQMREPPKDGSESNK